MAKTPTPVPLKTRAIPTVIASSVSGVSPMSGPSKRLQAMRNRANSTVGGHLYGSAERINHILEQRMGRQHNNKYRPRGAALAAEIFQTTWYGETDEAMEEYDENDKAQGAEEGYEWAYQPSLELETPIELQERLQESIRKFEYAHDKMAIAALRWHQLMEDVHDDEQVRKMFLDMQMIRKLSGMDSE